MINTWKVITVFFVGLVVGLVINALLPQALKLGGTTNFDTLALSEDLTVGDDATITGDLAVTGTTNLTGEITLSNCGTATYTLAALGPNDALGTDNSFATTTVTVTGAAVGDLTLVSNATTTNNLPFWPIVVDSEITADNTATVLFKNLSTATTTAGVSSTITVCYFN